MEEKQKDIQEKMRSLANSIKENNDLYYNKDMPNITDQEYDLMVLELTSLEEQHPELVDYTTPLSSVGGNTSSKLGTHKHRYPLLSLANVFSYEDISDFNSRIIKLTDQKSSQYVGELKIDGLSISLIYKKGRLVKAATRGNGEVGEDVTANILLIEDIPKELKDLIDIEVRGEIYMDNKTFDEINEQMQEDGLPLYRNPRNLAAGTLRQLNPDETKERKLRSFIYEITYIDGMEVKTQYEALEYLKELGFATNSENILGSCEDIIDFCKKINTIRNSLEYGIDGVVIKLNDLSTQASLGSTGKSPRWATAYKFPPEQKETTINDIFISVGRTGALTPVAILEPILLAGSIISKATLHNEDYVLEKDIRIGDTILLQKAGDVIPEVVRVVLDKRKTDSEKFEFPDKCPVCGSEVVKTDATIKCINTSGCEAQRLYSLIHFVGKKGMDIDGMGDKIVETLLANKLIYTYPDIYKLEADDILKLDGFKSKSTMNLLRAINESRYKGLQSVIYGFGIPLVGERASKVLCKNFDTIDKIMNASLDELQAVSDIGNKMAENIYSYFKKQDNIDIVEGLRMLGVSLEYKAEKESSNKLANKKFVITGSFMIGNRKVDRKEIAQIIELNGGKNSSSISKNTDFLIVGENAGSKADKATELAIPTISLEEFYQMIS